MKLFTYLLAITSLLISCKRGDQTSDAFGNFTATEMVISAETSGKILAKFNQEGDVVEKGNVVFVIDTIQSYLKKKELKAREQGIRANRMNIQAQIEVLEERRKALEVDISRFARMLEEGAASRKQVDDLENNLRVLEKQISQVKSNFVALDAEEKAITASLLQIEDMLRRSLVTSPVNGTLLETYAELGETVAPGKPLFKIADLSSLELKAYFSSDQLTQVKLSDTVEVLTDDGKGGLLTYSGRITWIASDAEFTPKIIQTREERVNLVYAVKIRVVNDGTLKINMPGEVRLLP
jgi:HlyD family secretion protein